MIDKKTRIKLRSLAMTIKSTMWVGKDGFSENVLAKKVVFINDNSPEAKIDFQKLNVKPKVKSSFLKKRFLEREPQVAKKLNEHKSAKKQYQFLQELRTALLATKPNSPERKRCEMIYELFKEKYRKSVNW